MGLTERHWFEDEEPELTERQLVNAVEEQKAAYIRGYYKGYSDGIKEQKAVVRCKDCKHRPKEPNWETHKSGFDIEFPEGSKCPCQCSDDYYSWYPEDDWFCANGEGR